MFPGARRSALQTSPATTLIAGTTALVSALITLSGAESRAALIAGFVPASVTGVVVGPPGIWLAPAWITPLTATLVHGGLLHLGFNLVLLVYCSLLLERTIGSRLTALLYGVGAYAAAAGQWAFGPNALVPMVGASGAVSALVGAYALLFAQQPVPRIGPIPARAVRIAWLAAAWIAIQLLVGFASGSEGIAIATGAHVGGFIAGLALARPLLLWRYRRA